MIIFMQQTIDYFFNEKIFSSTEIEHLLSQGEVKQIKDKNYLVINTKVNLLNNE